MIRSKKALVCICWVGLLLPLLPASGQFYSESSSKDDRVFEGELLANGARVTFKIREGQMVVVRSKQKNPWYSFVIHFDGTKGPILASFEITGIDGGESVEFVASSEVQTGKPVRIAVKKRDPDFVTIVVKQMSRSKIVSPGYEPINSDEAGGDRCCITCGGVKYCANMISIPPSCGTCG